MPGENPFAIFSPAAPFPPPQSNYKLPAERVVQMPMLQLAVSNAVAIPDNRFSLSRESLATALKPLAGPLMIFLIAFSLLPDSLQMEAYYFLGLRQPATISQELVAPLPVRYAYISSPFGKRWGRQHQGIDLAASQGSPIHAASAGKVVYSGWESGYGKSIIIDHGKGLKTRYAHCSKLIAAKGAKVAKGAVIAQVGSTGHSTGPHLHFEVIVNGVRKNPAWYYPLPVSLKQIAQAKN